MSTLRNTLLTITATGLLSAAATANASDDTTSTAQTLEQDNGSYSVSATDRGGKESGSDDMDFELTLLEWLRGLMD